MSVLREDQREPGSNHQDPVTCRRSHEQPLGASRSAVGLSTAARWNKELCDAHNKRALATPATQVQAADSGFNRSGAGGFMSFSELFSHRHGYLAAKMYFQASHSSVKRCQTADGEGKKT